MKKKILSLSLLILSIAALSSCSQDEDALRVSEGTISQPQQPVEIVLEASLEDMEVDDLFAGELRGIGYDLSGEHKMPKINFGATGAAAGDVPVHAFFRNAKDGKTHYVLLRMSRVSSRSSLLREFGLIDMKNKLTTANADHWYVKAFIGGYPEKSGVGGNWPGHNQSILDDGSANRIRFLMDATPDIVAGTSTISIPDGYYKQNKWSYGVRPLPMQTEWTKFTFSHTSAGGANNPKYTAKSARLTFKPVGTLLRVRIENKGKMPIQLNTFALHNAIENVDSNGQLTVAYPTDETIYVNHMTYTFDRTLSVGSNGKVNEATGRTFATPNNGTLTYHWYNNGTNSKRVTVEPGTYRVVFAWLHLNESNTQVKEMVFRPSIYVGADGDYANYVTKGSERIAAPTLKVKRDTFVEGKSYPIKITVYSKEDVLLSSDMAFGNYTDSGLYLISL